MVSPAAAQEYRYTGKELDPDLIAFNSENRRYHFPARFYLPQRGVFGQMDSLSLGQRLPIGVFVYAGQNPLVLVDPLGLQEGQSDPVCCNGGRIGDISIDKYHAIATTEELWREADFYKAINQGIDQVAAPLVAFRFTPSQGAADSCCCVDFNWIQVIHRIDPPWRGFLGDLPPKSRLVDGVADFNDVTGRGKLPLPYWDQGQRGTGDSKVLRDVPGADRQAKRVKSFESCLICVRQPGPDIVLGCYQWTWSWGPNAADQLGLSTPLRLMPMSGGFRSLVEGEFPGHLLAPTANPGGGCE
jgi:RHS repeat-associated protein